MTRQLEGRNAIVTGASRGIGAGIALELAKRGANVVLTYQNSASKAEDLAKKLSEDYSVKAYAYKSDAAEYDAPGKLVEKVMKVFNTIDILVNNAGTDDDGLLEDLTAEKFHRLLQINTVYPTILVKECIPHFGTKPRIVNMSSILARQAVAYGTSYCASKAALEQVTKVMAIELGQKHELTANCVNPGATATDMWFKTDPEVIKEFEAQVQSTPAAARIGTPEDIALVVAFLVDEGSRWCTGSTVCANGGAQFV